MVVTISESTTYSENYYEKVRVEVISKNHLSPTLFSFFSFYREGWTITVRTPENKLEQINSSIDVWKNVLEKQEMLVERRGWVSKEKKTGKVVGKPTYSSYRIFPSKL